MKGWFLEVFLIISSVIIPIGMFYLQHKNKGFRLFFNAIALISAIIFGNVSAIIYQILIDNAVFTTSIHSIFLNPFSNQWGLPWRIYYLQTIDSNI